MILNAHLTGLHERAYDPRELRHRRAALSIRPKCAPKEPASTEKNQLKAPCGVVCKTVGLAYDGSNPSPATTWKVQLRDALGVPDSCPA